MLGESLYKLNITSSIYCKNVKKIKYLIRQLSLDILYVSLDVYFCLLVFVKEGANLLPFLNCFVIILKQVNAFASNLLS